MTQKSIKKNTVFNAIKTLSSIIFPLITFPYISRVLLPANIGKINFGLSIVSYFSLIATLGINTYAVRECSSVRDNKKKLSNTASQIFSINIFTTIISYLILVITLVFYKKLENYRLLIAIQSLSILATTLGADWINSAMEDFKYITIRTVSFQIISLGFMFVFVHKPEDYMKYALISLVSSAGANLVNIFYRRKFCEIKLTRIIEWKKHISPICLLFVMILAQTVFNNIDITMLGIIKGDYEVGIYSTAHKIMGLINQVVASLCWVIMPRLSQYFERRDYNEVNKLLRKVLSFYITLGLPCIVGVCMISSDIITVIAGLEYAAASDVLVILMISFGFMLIGGDFLGNSILLPARKEKYFMIACCISTVVNIILNWFFIRFLGARGAAITTAISEFLILIMLFHWRDRKIEINNLGRIIIPPVIGCVFIALICSVLSGINSLWIRIIATVVLSGFIYIVVQVLLKNSLVTGLFGAIKGKVKRIK